MRTYLVEGADASSGCGTLQADAAHVGGNECEARSRIGLSDILEFAARPFCTKQIKTAQKQSPPRVTIGRHQISGSPASYQVACRGNRQV